MRKLSLFFFLLQMTFCVVTKANNISLYSGDVEFEVPDDYTEKAIMNNTNIGYYAESGNKAFALFAYRKSNFSVSKVFDGLDSCLCNLSNFKLVDTERECFWNMTTDYVTKKYVSDSGMKFASHTRYVTGGAYCLGFWYNTEEEYKCFQDIIDSIHFSEEDGLGQIELTMKYTTGIIWVFLVLFIIASFIAGIGGDKNNWKVSAAVSLGITIVVAILFLIPMWHFWVAYTSLLILLFVVCFLCAMNGMYLTFDAD